VLGWRAKVELGSAASYSGVSDCGVTSPRANAAAGCAYFVTGVYEWRYM
jgi:hypothetical protein